MSPFHGRDVGKRAGVCRPHTSRIGLLRAGAALALCTALASPVGRSQPGAPLPSTKPGELAGQFLKLCDAPQLGAITHWLTVNSAPELAASGRIGPIAYNTYHECTFAGGLRLKTTVESDPSSITVVLIGKKTNIWYRLTLNTNTEGKVAGVGYRPTVPPEGSLPKDLSDSAIRDDLGHFVSRLTEAGRFSGVIIVARGRNPIVTIGAGYADRSKHSLMTGHTQFTLASMGKMFTGVGIGQLVDAHELSYTDPVGRFFPDYPNRTVREKVTVGMLLSHTAGLGDFLGMRTPEMLQNGVKRAAEFMPLYDNEEPAFTPGTSWAYSNAGLALAGAILEKVSGEAYPDYIRRHIFAPAEMTESNPNNVRYRSADLVVPYTHLTPSGPSEAWYEAPADIGSPAGGAISTADDLVRFADALRSGKLVSGATLREMSRNRDPVPGGIPYGYAMDVENVYGSMVVGHNGGYAGVSTHLQIFLDAPYTIVVLENQDPPAEAYVSERAVALVAARVKMDAGSRVPQIHH